MADSVPPHVRRLLGGVQKVLRPTYWDRKALNRWGPSNFHEVFSGAIPWPAVNGCQDVGGCVDGPGFQIFWRQGGRVFGGACQRLSRGLTLHDITYVLGSTTLIALLLSPVLLP